MGNQQKPGRYSQKSALASEPSWSHYQQAVFDWMAQGRGNGLVNAVWGSGKSTLLVGCVNRVSPKDKAAILAFNVHISESMQRRVTKDGRSAIPLSRIKVGTANAVGHAILVRHFEGDVPEVNQDKYRQIARQLIEQTSVHEDEQGAAYAFLSRLIELTQSTLTDPTPENVNKLYQYYGLDYEVDSLPIEKVLPLASKALEMGERAAKNNRQISYTDQLWLPHIWELPAFPKQWLFVDEIQDANPAQLSLYKKMIASDGRALFVGDERQSIMGFAGADPQMWSKVKREFKTTSLPLSVCYRCPTSHLDLARAIAPQVEPRDGANEGTIASLHPAEIKNIVQPGDLILCRFTAPLVSLCLKLLINDSTLARVRGRDIASSIIAMAKRASRKRAWVEFVDALNSYIEAEVERLKRECADSQLEALQDRYHAILACYRAFGHECRNLVEFGSRIQRLFTDESAPVTLSTIHRAKGDEADRVFVLGANELPVIRENAPEWQKEQEINLMGVAITRAKSELFLVPISKISTEIDAALSKPLAGMGLTPVPLPPPLSEDHDWHFKKNTWVMNINPKPYRKDTPIHGRILLCFKNGYCTFARCDDKGNIRYQTDGGGKTHLAHVDFAHVDDLAIVPTEVTHINSDSSFSVFLEKVAA